MQGYDMSERELREFVEKEIERIDAFVKVLGANNKRIERDWQKSFRDAQMGISDSTT